MTVVIQNLVMKNNQQVSKMCSEAITTVFKNDTAGQVSLECVKLMSQKIHAMKYNVSVFSLEPFLSLRLQSELKQEETSYSEQRNIDKKRKSLENNKQHISKRQKKLNKYIKAAAEEFQEAEATYDKHQIQKNQSESLKHLFMTYFRILKNATKSPLIPSVLEGLAKYYIFD
jgi:nucleolar complex protein 3